MQVHDRRDEELCEGKEANVPLEVCNAVLVSRHTTQGGGGGVVDHDGAPSTTPQVLGGMAEGKVGRAVRGGEGRVGNEGGHVHRSSSPPAHVSG